MFLLQAIATNLNGEMTFIGSQVEQFLKHKATDLLGENILQIVVPDSRKIMIKLIEDLVASNEQQPTSQEGELYSSNHVDGAVDKRDNSKDGSDKGTSGSSDVNAVSLRSSEKSFPMQNIEVNMDAMQTDDADVSDSSADRHNNQNSIGEGKHKSKGRETRTEMSSITRQKSSLAESSSGNENEPTSKKVKIADAHKKLDAAERLPSSNTTSSKSSDGSQPRGLHRHTGSNPPAKSSEAADRSYSSSVDSSQSQQCKKRSDDEADDSGYRESNESPGDSSSSFDSSYTGSGGERGE